MKRRKTITKEEIKERIKNGEILPLTSDTIFKSIFIRNEKVLIKMVSDIFDIKEEEKPITVAGFETVASKYDGKTYRGDILIRLSDYSYVLVEMNNEKEDNVIDRNMVNLIRIHSQVLERGDKDSILKDFRLRGLNFNNFKNISGKPVERYAICELESGRIASLIYTFCNICLDKCSKLVYNVDIRKLPKAVRWGAIMTKNRIEEISDILGEDMLSMEEKEKLLDTIKEINGDDRLLDDWITEANAKMKLNNQIIHAKEEGIKEGIEKGIEKDKQEIIINMLKENADYNFISRVVGKDVKEIRAINMNLMSNLNN